MLLLERSTEVLLQYSLRHSEESLDGVVNNLGLSFIERYTIAPDFAVEHGLLHLQIRVLSFRMDKGQVNFMRICLYL